MNQRFTFANQQFLSGALDWTTDTFQVALIDTTQYAVQPTVHAYLADIPAAARVAVSGPLQGTTATGGVARASSLLVGPVFGPLVEALVVYHATGTDATSELICYLDTANGLPFNPQGNTVTIAWDTGPNGIFRL